MICKWASCCCSSGAQTVLRSSDGLDGVNVAPARQRRIYRASHVPRRLPVPVQGLYNEMKFERPSRVQAETLPMILNPPFRNLVAQAHNGSGKTTCFVLALLGRVDVNVAQPQCLCMCPTRELVVQNMQVSIRFSFLGCPPHFAPRVVWTMEAEPCCKILSPLFCKAGDSKFSTCRFAFISFPCSTRTGLFPSPLVLCVIWGIEAKVICKPLSPLFCRPGALEFQNMQVSIQSKHCVMTQGHQWINT